MLTDMPDGFPSAPRKHGKGKQGGGKHGDEYVITLRFPRFNTTVFYDPVFDMNDAELTDVTPSGGTASFASILPLIVALLLAFTANKFALRA